MVDCLSIVQIENQTFIFCALFKSYLTIFSWLSSVKAPSILRTPPKCHSLPQYYFLHMSSFNLVDYSTLAACRDEDTTAAPQNAAKRVHLNCNFIVMKE